MYISSVCRCVRVCVCEGKGGGLQNKHWAAKYGHRKRVLSPKNTTATHSGLPGFASSVSVCMGAWQKSNLGAS